MKLKTLLGVIAAGCLLGSAAFGQSLQIAGTVTAVTANQITLKSGTDTWLINRTPTTSVVNGNLTAGSAVTVKCNSPDAQKKESIVIATPTPAD